MASFRVKGTLTGVTLTGQSFVGTDKILITSKPKDDHGRDDDDDDHGHDDGHGHDNGTLRVAILSTPDFNAPAVVNQSTLRFGRTGNEQSLQRCEHKAHDVTKPKDRLGDLICVFDTEVAGFTPSDNRSSAPTRSRRSRRSNRDAAAHADDDDR